MKTLLAEHVISEEYGRERRRRRRRWKQQGFLILNFVTL